MTGHRATPDVPVACALTPAGLAGQAHRWQRLLGRALTARTETADGLCLSFLPEAEDELRALAAVEAGCCPWATWRVERAPGSVVLRAGSAAEEGAAALHGMFRADPGQGRPVPRSWICFSTRSGTLG